MTVSKGVSGKVVTRSNDEHAVEKEASQTKTDVSSSTEKVIHETVQFRANPRILENTVSKRDTPQHTKKFRGRIDTINTLARGIPFFQVWLVIVCKDDLSKAIIAILC